jgi:hypothetical protein
MPLTKCVQLWLSMLSLPIQSITNSLIFTLMHLMFN